MNLIEKTIKKNYFFKGKLINVRQDDAQLYDGTAVKREVVEHPGGVCVVALNNDDEIYFVKQFRYPFNKVILEIPAGKLEKGEDPLKCGMRELTEETGMIGEDLIFLGEMYPTTGYCEEIIYIYFTRKLTKGTQKLDDGEFLQVEKIHIDKALKMVMSNEIKDAKTCIGILKTAMLLNENKL